MIVIDNECVKIAFIVDDYTTDNSGGRNFSYVTKVEYSNELLGDKQKDAGRICSPLFANGVSGDVVEIKTASDLRNMSKSAHYVIINDIDLSGTEWSNPGISMECLTDKDTLFLVLTLSARWKIVTFIGDCLAWQTELCAILIWKVG